jgi:hypothetical protein
MTDTIIPVLGWIAIGFAIAVGVIALLAVIAEPGHDRRRKEYADHRQGLD